MLPEVHITETSFTALLAAHIKSRVPKTNSFFWRSCLCKAEDCIIMNIYTGMNWGCTDKGRFPDLKRNVVRDKYIHYSHRKQDQSLLIEMLIKPRLLPLPESGLEQGGLVLVIEQIYYGFLLCVWHGVNYRF